MDQAQFATLLVVALARATERILLVLVGALAVYLGYSLFRHIPSVNKSEGKLALPGGVSIFLTRIGPGVFFAFFGIAVIGSAWSIMLKTRPSRKVDRHVLRPATGVLTGRATDQLGQA